MNFKHGLLMALILVVVRSSGSPSNWGTIEKQGDVRIQYFPIQQSGFAVGYFPGGRTKEEAKWRLQYRVGKKVAVLPGGYFGGTPALNVDFTMTKGKVKVGYLRHKLRPVLFFGPNGPRIAYPGKDGKLGKREAGEQEGLAGAAIPTYPTEPHERHMVLIRKVPGRDAETELLSILMKGTYKDCVAVLNGLGRRISCMFLDGGTTLKETTPVPSWIGIYKK